MDQGKMHDTREAFAACWSVRGANRPDDGNRVCTAQAHGCLGRPLSPGWPSRGGHQ